MSLVFHTPCGSFSSNIQYFANSWFLEALLRPDSSQDIRKKGSTAGKRPSLEFGRRSE